MVLNGTAQAETLTGGADADTLYGYGGNDKLVGNAGDDVLAGMAGNDTLQGGEGDDYLLGGAGNDSLDGGNGVDWAAYEDAAAGVTVSLALTTAQNTGGGGTDKLVSIENLYGSAFNDVLTGDAGGNILAGDAGNDTLSGGAGDDFLVGGAGADVIDGGDGHDTVSYEGAANLVHIDLQLTQQVDVGGLEQPDRLTSIEAVIGSSFDDILSGNTAENYLAGGAGDDDLTAVGGGDVLDGGDGDDQIRASQVGAGDYLSGGAGNDVFFTQSGAATLDGGAGDDSFYVMRSPGMAGVTLVQGGEGSDTLELGNGYAPIGGAVANLSLSGAQDIGAGQLVDLQGVENLAGGMGNDVLTGDAGANGLHGGFGDDTLSGGGGLDTLSGASGRDVLTGGAGKDYFVFWGNDSLHVDATGAGVDVITDFQIEDQLKFVNVPSAISYFESSAASFASALATVNAVLTGVSNFHEYMAFQVGADVYVFSGHSDPNGAGLETVVKLANVNLDAIGYYNFLS